MSRDFLDLVREWGSSRAMSNDSEIQRYEDDVGQESWGCYREAGF
jgi:hypothetical protein